MQALTGVGPGRTALLKRSGVETIADLLNYFPRRYEDRRRFQPVSQLEDGSRVSVRVVVRSRGHVRRRPGLSVVEVPASDATGVLCLTWFNQEYMAGRFKPGQELLASGRARRQGNYKSLTVENCEPVVAAQEPLQVGRIVPIYPLAKDMERIGQTSLRRWMRQALEACAAAIGERLPMGTRERVGLIGISQALRNIHFPEDDHCLERARQRLAFEELFFLQLAFLQGARRGQNLPAPSITHGLETALQIARQLPFPLTGAQRRVLGEICSDMAGGRPMNRLLQGDVGSGKTLVAALAASAVLRGGRQVTFMAPTEVLVSQHFRSLSDLLAGRGMEVALLTGSLDEGEKRTMRSRLERGGPLMLVGTHALIQEQVTFPRLGLAIIDEQHRFGVHQRGLLRRKGARPGGGSCHLLVMTATPIPRTLTLAFYGDLEVSTINEMPPGRRPVQTALVSREEAHLLLAQHVRDGGQAYVVCPAIKDEGVEFQVPSSEPKAFNSLETRNLEHETKGELASVLSLAQELKAGLLASSVVGTLHGQMGREEKEAVLADFRRGDVQVLVATTVIEVGMDVPGASLILIEDAHRYGLAQLHQLRGRVGRGETASTCLLVTGQPGPEHSDRLQVLLETNDGFRIAEEDLRLRGPGEFYGLHQHGIPELKAANLATDLDILLQAREEAQQVLAMDPTLSLPQHRCLRSGVPPIRALVDHA